MAATPNPGADRRGLIFVTPAAYADQAAWHATAAELRREAPVLRVEAAGWSPFWAVTRHADVLDVSRRSDVFHNTPRSAPNPDVIYDLAALQGAELPHTLVHMHGPEHLAHRHLTNDWFKPANVGRLQGDIEAIAERYVKRMLELGGSCDFARDVAVPYTLHVIMRIFGVPEADEPLMLQLTQGLFGAADPEYLGDLGDPGELITRTMRTFDEYFSGLTADRRAHPTDDLASVLANGTIDGRPMGDRERLWYYVIIATAGHDTTSYALSGGLAELLRHPEQLAALRRRPELATSAAEEAIRWTSPVRSFLRWAQEDTEVGGVAIPAGDAVLTSYPSANRDEAVFERPMEFDITRPDAGEHLAFGMGVHHCLGAHVARREIRTFLRVLLERVDDLELAGEPEQVAAHFVGGVKHLPVRYRAR